MEPLLTAGAIATLVLTKALEKVGEKFGEQAMEQAGKLMNLLKAKSPETAGKIERVTQQPELAQQQPEVYSLPVIAKQIEQVAATDSEVDKLVQGMASMINAQPQNAQNIITTNAQKVGVVAPGSVFGDINIS